MKGSPFAEGRPSLMTYSEFLRGGKLNKKNLTSIATASAVPGIVETVTVICNLSSVYLTFA